MRSLPLVLLFLPSALASCPLGQFDSTSSYVICAAYNGGSQTATVASTKGILSMFTIPSSGTFECRILLSPNASLGSSNVFSVQMVSYDLENPIRFFSCDSASGPCTQEAWNVGGASASSSTPFQVFSGSSSVLIVATASSARRSNFLLSWDSQIVMPRCSACLNLIPLASNNYNINSPDCSWKCNAGYYIPTSSIVPSATGLYITRSAVSCVPCTACPAGQFTNPLVYNGGCFGYAFVDQGSYGANINSRDSVCRPCTVCSRGYVSACSSYADAVCV